MTKNKSLIILFMFPILSIITISTAIADVPRMTKDELKGLLGNPAVIILDVRVGRDWKDSEFKIKGAVREETVKFSSWATKYPKDKTIVLYCA